MELQVVVILCLLGASSAHWKWWGSGEDPEWDDLKVTWGLNPFRSFQSLPRTLSDAQSKGWFGDQECDSSPNLNYRGQRYSDGGDLAVTVLYDKNGYIAGLQTKVDPGAAHDYPTKGLVPPFVYNGVSYVMTVYFTNPSTICTTGRTEEEFNRDGTGTDLYIQIGPHPDTDIMKIPVKEADLAGTKWVEGKCFWSMGKHYWFNITDDMSCDKMFPVFLLYNDEKLNAFGWAMSTALTGDRYEHPGADKFRLFMKSVPECLKTRGEISTMHVFLTNSPFFKNHC